MCDGPVPGEGLPNAPGRGDRTRPGRLRRPAHASSPVDTEPMSPPAATDRSPEELTGPLGRDGEVGIVGAAPPVAPFPVDTVPILPPAATDRAPLALTDEEGVGADPSKAYSVTASPSSPAAPPATLAQGSAASTFSTPPTINPAAPATQSPTPAHTNAFDRVAMAPIMEQSGRKG
ncbi:hypothetical protein GCM10018780_72370 [Streptomyces lanatus]|nr:hypothetical protein GCM10018780_72370 [Streptomyces lanatus]